jgi:catechol 2,3-dioxygenase-like lactoylglutathione lyase family enzyme
VGRNWQHIEASEDTMEIGARLHHLQLLSPDPETCARFYGRVYGMQVKGGGERWICSAPQRRVLLAKGPANQLNFAAYAFGNDTALHAYREDIESRIAVHPGASPVFGSGAFTVIDPDGNRIVFGADNAPASVDAPALSARLQHFAIRSHEPEVLVAFYRDTLGFVVSDRVEDDHGGLSACFLRTDAEHHALAIFRAPEVRHDHMSFEVTDWREVRDWADRVGALGVPMVWGVGRHGPGNDTFFMVRDPDGNLAEISAELEVCAPGRPAGTWPHEQRTLNLWGVAIMRS